MNIGLYKEQAKRAYTEDECVAYAEREVSLLLSESLC